MQPFLALLTAFAWGSGNFAMGIASKRHIPRLVVLAGFGAGLIGALIYAAIAQPVWSLSPLVWGAASGVAQGVGWALMSYAMQIGRVSIVAPITAAGQSTLLFVGGAAFGDAVSPVAVAGAVVVVGAIILLTTEHSELDDQTATAVSRAPRRLAVWLAVIVAGCFALQAVCLKQAANDEPAVVMVGARLAVVLLIGTSLIARPVGSDRDHRNLVPAVIGGSILLVGDVVYLAALRNGPLSVAGVLSGVHPAFTILLAGFILREKLLKSQYLGVVLALVGSGLLAVA